MVTHEGSETVMPRKRKERWRYNSDYHLKPPPLGYMDWQLELKRFLIAKGTNGVRQGLITQRFANWCDSAIIVNELETMLIEGKVQKFKVPRTGSTNTPTIWRATDKILED